MEDKLLVLRCKRGSREALARIYHKYKADLLLLSAALLNDRAAAEDVVHDVFVSFVRGLDGFRLTGSLKGFLLTCAANHARNWNKAERRRGGLVVRAETARHGGGSVVGVGPALERSPAETVEPVEAVVANEQAECLGAAMAELPFEQREVVMLHLHGAMTFKSIARVCGISPNTAKSRYRYGLDKLRSLLNGEAT